MRQKWRFSAFRRFPHFVRGLRWLLRWGRSRSRRHRWNRDRRSSAKWGFRRRMRRDRSRNREHRWTARGLPPLATGVPPFRPADPPRASAGPPVPRAVPMTASAVGSPAGTVPPEPRTVPVGKPPGGSFALASGSECPPGVRAKVLLLLLLLILILILIRVPRLPQAGGLRIRGFRTGYFRARIVSAMTRQPAISPPECQTGIPAHGTSGRGIPPGLFQTHNPTPSNA